MEPLISVIVPVYNVENYLEKCVDSIIAQTYKNIEVILVDDGSTDKSATICDKYSQIYERIKVIHKVNGGLSSARNAGLEVCSGDFVGFVDSDDWIFPTMYEDLLSISGNNSTVATIGVNYVLSDDRVIRSRRYENSVITKEQFLHNILCRQEGCSVCSRLFPRDMIKDKRFDENKLNEDVLFIISIMEKTENISYTSSIGYNYFQREGSISNSFGKSVHDMIGNSVTIRRYIENNYPSLFKEAERFEIFQHMSFLLCCPSKYDTTKDPLYGVVFNYIKKNRFRGVINPCFSYKEKFLLWCVSFCPRTMVKVLESRKNNGKRMFG